MNNRSKMPKKVDIYKCHSRTLRDSFGKFWLEEYDELYSEERKDILDTCFACGSTIGVQRSHIKPNWKGGTEDVNNLHLLCPMCHIESESYEGDLYKEWLHFKTITNSGSRLMINNRIDLIRGLIEAGKTHLLPNYLKTLLTSHKLINPS